MGNSESKLENLFLEGTPKTPRVNFKKNGRLEIEGKSILDNSIEFYKPLLDWIDKYSENPANSTELNIKFEYFNISSSKCLFDMFRRIESIHKAKDDVVINWYHKEDDENMVEAGENYEAAIRVPFKMIEGC